MKFKFKDRVKVIKGFYTGRTGEIRGKFLFWSEVKFDENYSMTTTILTKHLQKIEDD